MSSDLTPDPNASAVSGGRPPTVFVVVSDGAVVSVHTTWEGAHSAREALLAGSPDVVPGDDISGQAGGGTSGGPSALDEEAISIEAMVLQPGLDAQTRNRELDRTRELRVANARCFQIHASTLCLRPNGHCWIHDPSPAEVHPLRGAPVFVADSGVIYRGCRHSPSDTHVDLTDVAGPGLHVDPDWLAFASWASERPVVAPHPCCSEWCCLPEPPTDADHARAEELTEALRRLAAEFDLEPVTADDERQVLQDCVLERLARQRERHRSTSPDHPDHPDSEES